MEMLSHKRNYHNKNVYLFLLFEFLKNIEWLKFKDLMDNVIRQTFRNDNLNSLTNIKYEIRGINN